jgi:AraC-like DNA-binding protein
MVRLDSLRNFRELVALLGGDPCKLLSSLQIEPALLDRSNEMISHAQLVQLFERAAAELRCPDFGMRLAAAQAQHGATRALGPLDVAMRNAPTLGDAFKYCADHLHMYSSSAQLCFEKRPGDPRVFMMLDVPTVGLHQQRQGVEYALVLAQHAVHAISGGRARASEVWFTHQPSAPLAEYRAHLNATVRFGQEVAGLFLDEQDLRLPVPGTNSQLYEIATSFIDHRYPTAATWLSKRVRNLIARLLVQGTCTHEHVASKLRLHPRTLQRRLRDEGETFEGIKDAVRRDIALRYLRQPDVSLVRVTEILGYSETSVLSRSCHRWFAASPREVRNGLGR